MANKRFRYSSIADFLGLLLMVSILALQVEPVDASSKSPYDSGYDHGCDDADISDPDDRYINQPGKGPSSHTNEFMDGYNDGYDDCSNSNSEDDSDEGRRSNDDRSSSSGYSLTVNVPSHPFGASTVDIDITTANGHTDSATLSTATSGTPSHTFNIPENQGNSVYVCVDTGVLDIGDCETFTTNGRDTSVSLDAR